MEEEEKEEEVSIKKKEEVRSRPRAGVYFDWQVWGATHSLVLHAGEDDVKHLGEGGFSCRLVDEVLAGQIDVVARPDGLQHRALVDLDVLGGHRRQQGLGNEDGTGMFIKRGQKKTKP